MAGPLAVAGIQAGASLVGGLMSAKAARKQRIADAKSKQADVAEKGGQNKAKALQSIISNLRGAAQG